MNWLHDPDKDEYFSRVDDEVRPFERRLFGGGADVGIVLGLLITSLGVGCIAGLVLLWRALTG